ncbi:hypothetical protein F444_22997 [Phytophthora nicotianae P1976]|uniref:Chromo domain-containing protein n=1 Tax=Phytophthora nicotianae P1976 TaxID=1317066 RepID=A0A080YW61_PHYNI|nr:hypothetical protein F444_22997 [Phytophthora nicotianae P1976]
MTGLPAINPLDPVVTPEGMEAASLDEVRAIRGANFAKLAKALEELHKVVDTSSNWVFTSKNLLTGETKEAHATRLTFYADSSLRITEDLLAHVPHNSEGHVVEKLLEARYDATSAMRQLLVKWRGLCELENTWDPV